MSTRFHALVFAFLGVFFAGPAGSAEIKVICTAALGSSLKVLRPAFEKQTGHRLMIAFGATDELKTSIEKGAKFDLAILSAQATGELMAKGFVTEDSLAPIARSLGAVAVRSGAARPDISTVDGFKRAILDAKSIAYTERGLIGIHMKSLAKLLRLESELAAKVIYKPGAQAVAAGEAELGLAQVSEIVGVAGAELLAPLPEGIALITDFHAALGTQADETCAASQLIEFLSTEESHAVLRSKGLETPNR